MASWSNVRSPVFLDGEVFEKQPGMESNENDVLFFLWCFNEPFLSLKKSNATTDENIRKCS